MFPLVLRKNLFFLLPSSQLGRLLIRFLPVREFSSRPPPPPPPPQSHWNWNCSCNVPVIVWWDVDNCGVPSGVSFSKVAPSIMAAVRANGIKGGIQILAYGDFQSPKVDGDALLLTNITFQSAKSFSGDNAYKALLRDLNFWVSTNPPPAHLFLILGDRDDRDFSRILHQLRMNNYNILIACSGRASDTLCSATTIMWQWSSMLKGEDVIGKHFNHPPDAPFNSFYGGLKMPLGNPFSATQEPTSSHNAKIQQPFSDIKLSEVPKSLYWQVRKILSWYPNGVPSTSSAAMNKQTHSRKEVVDEVCHSSFSSPVDNSLVEKNKRDGSAETYSKSSTLFCWNSSWWPFWKSSSMSGDFTHQDFIHSRKPELFEDSKSFEVDQTAIHFEEPKSLELQQDVSHSGMLELFSIDSFWDDVESFVFTPRGSHLLSQSRSREDLAHKLQKHGPSFLMRLTENDILQLVELLIAEKKWLKESPSQEFPFRLTEAVQKSS